MFFEEAVTAASARRLGSFVLTESMERHPDLGFGSYDRFFPNQDTLPHGGFGNLIALPLQKEPRDLGNSVFLDDQMVPYGDQWAFLASVTRIGRTSSEARGVERARSASEAFLYRRLETLPETKGRFQLNVRVPIAFDRQSQMEVDFLNEPLRIVVELDGSQHLSDPEAYLRDRRKDRLVQQNGYLILRFLAEDVGKDLDGVFGFDPAVFDRARTVEAQTSCVQQDNESNLYRRRSCGPFGLRRVI